MPRRALLLIAIAAALGAQQRAPSYDAASLKPHVIPASNPQLDFPEHLQLTHGKAHASRTTIRALIYGAYGLTPYQVTAGPAWLDTDTYDLEAKADHPADEPELRQMLQTLLAQRCSLAVHTETREIPVYELTIGKSGIRLPQWKPGDPPPARAPRRPDTPIAGNMSDSGTIQHLADSLSTNPKIGRPVIDKTGLTESYRLILYFYPAEDFITSIQDATGLKFESRKLPMPVLIIDHADRPAAN